MSFLLKIVEGPNKGAEIALVEGTTISMGRGDDCDIILTDSLLDEKACDVEVTQERVMLLYPDGRQLRMEPFKVVTIGATSLALGPEDGAWRDLIWEKPVEKTLPPEHIELEEADGENPAKSDDIADEVPRSEKKASILHSLRWIWLVVIFLIAMVISFLIALYLCPEKISQVTGGRCDKVAEICNPFFERCSTHLKRGCETVREWFKSEEQKKAEALALIPVEKLDDIVGELGLEKVKSPGGKDVVKGDFATRVDRLRATARIYHSGTNVELDFVDQESLYVAIESLLSLVTDGRIKLEKLEGRAAALKGVAFSTQDLRKTLDALSRDVPKLEKVDCAGVTLGTVETDKVEDVGEDLKIKVAKHPSSPSLPVVGILTTPYKCLVLKSGARVVEGAHFGDFTITAIHADSVELSNGSEKFFWRP